jgi:putative SOS response-associated peptidase YedK
MCARLSLTTTVADLAEMFSLGQNLYPPHAVQNARYNVAPSTLIPVVRFSNGTRELTEMRWGFVPHWNTDPKPAGYVNARSESAAGKPAFREAFRHRRCLVPADGFFEWKKVGKRKQPYFIRPCGGGLFVHAGLWDCWDGPDGPVETVAILTVAANELITPLHDRMPAILGKELFEAWLDPTESRPEKLLAMLSPFPAERMEMWPVSERVNAVSTDGPDLLTAVAEKPLPSWTQPTLFDLS